MAYIYIAGHVFGSQTKMGIVATGNLNLSLCNVNMYSIVQCRDRVRNPNPSLFLNPCPTM